MTLIEMLVVVVIMAVLLAIALPLYLRAVRDSDRQGCRTNMQTIATACQAYRTRNKPHVYPGAPPTEGGPLDLSLITGLSADLLALPRCPRDRTADTPDYTAVQNADGTITITCACDDAEVARFHNEPGRDGAGYTPGVDGQ